MKLKSLSDAKSKRSCQTAVLAGGHDFVAALRSNPDMLEIELFTVGYLIYSILHSTAFLVQI